MKTTHTSGSIGRRLTVWFLIVALLPLASFGIVAYLEQVRAIKDDAFSKLTAVRDLKVQRIGDWLSGVQRNAQTVALEAHSHLAPDGALHTDPASIGAMRRFILNLLSSNTEITDIQVIDATTGMTLVSNRQEQEGRDLSDSLNFLEPRRTGKTFINDIHFSTITNSKRMNIALPLLAPGSGGKVLAVVVADIRMELLDSLLGENTGLGQSGETLVVNKDVVAVNNLRWKDNAALNFKIGAAPAVLAASGKTGIIETEDYRGVSVLAAYSFMPATSWGFVAKQDLSELYGPIASLNRKLILIAGLCALAVIGMAFRLSKGFVKPISEMKNTALALSRGELGVRNPIAGNDELTVLARSINDMADRVASQMSILEGDRTIAEAIVRPTDMESFCKDLLFTLMRVVKAEMGVFYLPDGKGRFSPFASFGLSTPALESFDAASCEGMIGAALVTRDIARVRDIPPDSKFSFRTFAGDIIPRDMLTIPVIVGNNVAALIALGSLSAFTDESLSILEASSFATRVGLANQLANGKTRHLVEELSAKTLELEAQAAELSSQSLELRKQSEQLRAQNVELEAQSASVNEANRLKSEFLSTMSHELRTPLNSVLALSRVLIMQGMGRFSAEETGYLEIIERNGKNLLRLINDILDLAKIESGKLELVCEDFSIADCIVEIKEGLEPLCREKGIAIFLDIPENLPSLRSDKRRAHQILMNTMGNAVKFTAKGQIRITAGVTVGTGRQEIAVTVRDTGIGIPEKDLPFIFDEFRQVDGSSARSYEGTGLGLAIAAKSVRLLGGRIEVVSTVGVGSTFTVFLPLGETDAPAAGTEGWTEASLFDEETDPHRSDDPRRILLVEDSEPAIIQIRLILEQEGYHVEIARDGLEGMALMAAARPDGIILDLMMPGVDGFQTLERLRGTPSTAHTPVLILTAKDLTREDLGRLSANHVQQLVRKGDVDRQELLAKIARMLGKDGPRASVPGDAAPGAKPVSAPNPEPRPPATLPSPYPSTRKKPLPGARPVILAIEDNPDNMTTLGAILAGDYDFLQARDGETGLAIVAESRPDLVILDISLPGLSGIEVLRRLRADQAAFELPIIALSALAMKEDRQRALDAGCDEYLTKPIEVAELKESVARLIGGRKIPEDRS